AGGGARVAGGTGYVVAPPPLPGHAGRVGRGGCTDAGWPTGQPNSLPAGNLAGNFPDRSATDAVPAGSTQLLQLRGATSLRPGEREGVLPRGRHEKERGSYWAACHFSPARGRASAAMRTAGPDFADGQSGLRFSSQNETDIAERAAPSCRV